MNRTCLEPCLVNGRETIIMSKKNKKKTRLDKLSIKKTAILAAITVVFTTITQWGISEITGIFDLPERFASLESRMEIMQNSIDEISVLELNTKIATLETNVAALERQVSGYQEMLFSGMRLVPTEYATNQISLLLTTVENNQNNKIEMDENTILAINAISGEEYSTVQLANQKILLPYIEEETEVYFYGKINEEMHWDGECLINAYDSHDELSIIMEAQYDDGELKEYKQVIPYTAQNGTDVWVVSERKHEGDINIGESRNYIRQEIYKKDFDINTVVSNDMLTVDEIISSDLQLEAYYYGNTSNGFYNDDTGNAYLVKYAQDGTVMTLYKGRFKDGQFHDNTGNAWYIVRSKDTDYMYFKGVFEYGSPIKDGNSVFENPLSKEQIEGILEKETINCNLVWYGLDVI